MFVTKGQDGVWIHFRAPSGKQASLALNVIIANTMTSIVREALQEWSDSLPVGYRSESNAEREWTLAMVEMLKQVIPFLEHSDVVGDEERNDLVANVKRMINRTPSSTLLCSPSEAVIAFVAWMDARGGGTSPDDVLEFSDDDIARFCKAQGWAPPRDGYPAKVLKRVE